MEARKTSKNCFFFFGECRIELESLYLTLCKILRKIKTLAVHRVFRFSGNAKFYSESKKIQLSRFLTVAGI